MVIVLRCFNYDDALAVILGRAHLGFFIDRSNNISDAIMQISICQEKGLIDILVLDIGGLLWYIELCLSDLRITVRHQIISWEILPKTGYTLSSAGASF
jgi:hypothetical protein